MPMIPLTVPDVVVNDGPEQFGVSWRQALIGSLF
jgi:hypothetical protein